jgi:N-acetylneuraminate synthase
MMDENEIIEFCQEMEMRICLDVSHTKLATQFLKHDFCTAIKALAPYAAHLHLADAKGLHGEGLQINDGEIDWPTFMDLRASKLANVSFIVEIWQGHKNKNFGAKKALYRLQDASQIGTRFPEKLFGNDSNAPVELVHKENMKINRR